MSFSVRQENIFDLHRVISAQSELTEVCYRPHNELLKALPEDDLAQVLNYAERVELGKRQVVEECQTFLCNVYFLESGVASLSIKAIGDRANVEIRTLGQRDFVGLAQLYGMGGSPHRCTMQVPGQALRINAERFDFLLNELPVLRSVLLRYAHDMTIHSAHLLACNTRHKLQQRLARWLLVARYQLGSDQIKFTHDGLGRAIGVRRAGITTEMGRLERAGFIKRGRGTIDLTNVAGLKNTSCGCYRILAGSTRPPSAASDNILSTTPGAGPFCQTNFKQRFSGEVG